MVSAKPTFSSPTDALNRYMFNQTRPINPANIYRPFDDPTINDPPKNPPANTSGDTGTTGTANDWYKQFFASYNLPPDVQTSLLGILTKYASDPSTGQALATQYLRSTPWYQTTFPGFSAGVNNGIFGDETGYRSYLNAINNVYNQYLGRHVSGDEVNALLKEGATPQMLANRFQGQAYIQANKNDIQYLSGAFGNGQLTQDQLTALGNENAGIDTAQGQIQQKILAKSQQIRDRLFQGTLATPSLTIGANGLSSPSLVGTRQAPDVAA